jgi:hypothetical protein
MAILPVYIMNKVIKGTVKKTKQEKAREIIEKGLIAPINDDIYFVTSQTNPSKGYEVNYVFHHCECKAKELYPTEDCKHLIAIGMMKTEKLQRAFSEAMVKAVKKLGGVKA